MRNISDKICRENQKAHSMFNNVFFENRCLWDVEKFSTSWQATDDDMARAHCMLDT